MKEFLIFLSSSHKKMSEELEEAIIFEDDSKKDLPENTGKLAQYNEMIANAKEGMFLPRDAVNWWEELRISTDMKGAWHLKVYWENKRVELIHEPIPEGKIGFTMGEVGAQRSVMAIMSGVNPMSFMSSIDELNWIVKEDRNCCGITVEP